MVKSFYSSSRKINWKSSLDPRHYDKLTTLQIEMAKFYTTGGKYYDDIDFTADTWDDVTQLEAQDILMEATRHNAVIEVGCGRANILKSGSIDQNCYTGIDLSPEVIRRNSQAYPNATFHCIEDISRFPMATGQYNFVFSHYVLEHCVFPNKFLDECVRVLQPGGTLSILCPDFLGAKRMSSQRSGFSAGSGREKLARHSYVDAFVTGFDNKIRIPLYASWFRLLARFRPRFYINLDPTCFTDKFTADVDAVYLTFAEEIRNYLDGSINWESLSESLSVFGALNSHIYLKGLKVRNDS
jgi:SAM-dependent methyltransferase